MYVAKNYKINKNAIKIILMVKIIFSKFTKDDISIEFSAE